MYSIHKFIFLFFTCICIAESADPISYYCNPNSKTMTGSQIEKNIRTLLPNLLKNSRKTGFFSNSSGQGRDQVFGLVQCRGDLSRYNCSTCIQEAINNALKICPNQSDSKFWYEYCFLRYNSENFTGKLDTTGLYLYNVENVTDAGAFNTKLGTLMNKVNSEAAKPSNKGHGKGKSQFLNETIYALDQCTRDLSSLDCAQCLYIANESFKKFCADKRGCQVLYSSCYVRYELYSFYFPLHSKAPPDPSHMKYNTTTVFEPNLFISFNN